MEDNIPICSPGNALGLGCWAIGGHGWGVSDDAESKAAIEYAFNNGVRLFDTADCYGLGHSEKLLAEALGGNRHHVHISTKGGVRWDDNGKVWKDNTPQYLRSALEASLERLQLDSIPLYFVHWPDGKTPIAEVMAELGKMREEGLIRAVGLSNFPVSDLEIAFNTGKVDVVQVKVNLLTREDFFAIEPLCQKNSVRIMAFGCLAEGLLTGKFSVETIFSPDDHRLTSAEFQGKRWLRNLGFVKDLKDLAKSFDTSVSNIALGAVLGHQGVGCVLFGARNVEQVKHNLGSQDIDTTQLRQALDDLVQNHGFSVLRWQK